MLNIVENLICHLPFIVPPFSKRRQSASSKCTHNTITCACVSELVSITCRKEAKKPNAPFYRSCREPVCKTGLLKI